MAAPLNIVLLITDGHGHHTGDLDWGTEEFRGLRSRLERLQLRQRGFAKFNNVISPAASTIMSIESILSGIYAAKTHKKHWREWPPWDRFDHPLLSTFLQERGYEVNGFSYLLNSANWMPGIKCYKPELYRDFPSHKRDTHSHEAVLMAVKHFFAHGFNPGRPQFLMVHSIFVFDFWDELMELFIRHGLIDENTILAFTSDHYFPKNFGRQWLLGERDHSTLFHHTDLTEYNTRVFLYLKFPGLKPREIDEVVSGYDIAPTLLELIRRDEEWPGIFDGKSLLPLLEEGGRRGRSIRSDNVYPYQIGEKQGRITAIRCGRYKYVHRPDAASSYIDYRMHEPWSRVLGHEELYDIVADAEEQANLIHCGEPEVREALHQCRQEWQRTTDDIFAYHAQGLCAYAKEIHLDARLLTDRKNGCMLWFQTCPAEVCVTLLHVVAGILPGVRIDIVARSLGSFSLPQACTVITYPAAEPYTVAHVRHLLGERLGIGYDAWLRTSNVPVGDYAVVYDEAAHPIGDFAAAGAAIRALSGESGLSLGLDLSLAPIADEDPRMGWRLRLLPHALINQAARWLLAKLKPHLQRWSRSVQSGGSKMPRHFSERVIRGEKSD